MSTLLKKSVVRMAISLPILSLLLVSGCTRSENAPASVSAKAITVAQPAGPAQIVPAKTAFWPMYTAAHQWASDVVVLRVTAKEIPGFKNEAGNAAVWEGAFGSPSQGKYRIITYSVADAPPNVFKGVKAGLALPWGGVTREAMPVDLSMFNVDSDAAWQAASADAADWLKKNPGKPLTAFEIGDTWRFQVPVWYILWGDKKSGYAALVDASSGKVLKHK